MAIADKVRSILRDLIGCLQRVALYSPGHKIFLDSVDKTYEHMRDVFEEKGEIIVGIISGEFVFEKEIFFELSNLQIAKNIIDLLQAKQVDKIIFYPGLSKEDLANFVVFLMNVQKESGRKEAHEFLAASGIKNIALGRPSGDTGEGEPQAALEVSKLEEYLRKSSGFIDTVLKNQETDAFSMKINAMEIVDNLSIYHREILKLTSIKRHDVTTYLHIVNVSILSMYFSSKIGFSKNDVLDIGLAAMFHDIGKIYISQGILDKRGKLTEEEFGNIRNHAEFGSRLLLKYVPSLGVLPVLVAFEHHLGYNSKGYPKLPFTYKPHTVSLIVSICDVYDALYQRRSYKRDYPPEFVYNIMIRDKGTFFDPELIDKFFKIVGVWPIGTVVLLSDGRIAIVRQENEEDIFSPRVEAVHPQEEKELIDLKERKSELKITRSLNPFTEGKLYLHLV
ncbi:MAG: HD domain-containing protein [Candidatus Omnitrophica bacterium]|nr:HD domain-containing protein [Candidatus Omnitrophota bacterium]